MPREIKAQGLRVSPELFARLRQFVSPKSWTGKSRRTMWLTRDLMTAVVRSYAKESPWHSRELALAPDLAACGQFLQPRSSLKRSRRKPVLYPQSAGQA